LHVTFGQGGGGSGGGGSGGSGGGGSGGSGGGNTGGKEEPQANGEGGHLEAHQSSDKDKNHWKKIKWIYRCAPNSQITSILPNFAKSDGDDVMNLFVKHVKCSKLMTSVRDIPTKCNWYPSICPPETIHIQGVRKNITNGQAWFEWHCCTNMLGCLNNCQEKTAQLQSDQRIFLYPEQQQDSNQLAPPCVSIFFHDMSSSGQSAMDWKCCANASICYTPPPGGPGAPGAPGGCGLGCLGLLGLLGLLALLALGNHPSSSAAAPATTAAG